MMELLDFINTQLGFVAERELNVCYYYFCIMNPQRNFLKIFREMLATCQNNKWYVLGFSAYKIFEARMYIYTG